MTKRGPTMEDLAMQARITNYLLAASLTQEPLSPWAEAAVREVWNRLVPGAAPSREPADG